MYSITQLQALDYLLKRITSSGSRPLNQKKLKLVVEVNQTLWYGDFIQEKDGMVYQSRIHTDRLEIKQEHFTYDTVFKQIWQAYTGEYRLEHVLNYDENSLECANNTYVLFSALKDILDQAKIVECSSPLYPYLFNAQALNSNLQLPYIQFCDTKNISLVSMISLDESVHGSKI